MDYDKKEEISAAIDKLLPDMLKMMQGKDCIICNNLIGSLVMTYLSHISDEEDRKLVAANLFKSLVRVFEIIGKNEQDKYKCEFPTKGG
jgi:hypothetical protein